MPRVLGGLIAAVLFAQPLAAGEPEQQALAAINAARAEHGCPALAVNPQLQAAAEAHARAMATEDFFGHANRNGGKFSARIKAHGYHHFTVAENIAAGQRSAAEVVNEWLASAGHRRNILNCHFQETGLALAYQADDAPINGNTYPLKYYWVEDFGAP